MRTFLIIWSGQMISLIGSAMTSFALGVWIFEKTGSATQFALNVVCFFLPGVILAPFAGIAADRYSRRLVMMGSDLLAAISTITVLTLFATGNLHVWHVYLATTINSIATTFQWPAYGAAVTMLVPKEHLGRTGGMMQAAESISSFIAPAVAGLLYVSVGMPAIFAIDLGTFAIAFLTLSIVRIPHPERITDHSTEHTGLRGFLHEASFGWRYLRERPGLFNLLLVFAACNFVANLAWPLLGPMILAQASPDVYGYVGSVIGLGAVVGTIIMSIWGGPKRRIFGIAYGDITAGLLAGLVGLRNSLLLMATAGFAAALTNPITNGSSQALWQSKVAADVQGRVFAVRRAMAFSIIPISTALAGPVADYIFKPAMMPGGALANTMIGQILGMGPGRGIGLMFVICGLAYSCISAISLIHPRIRRVELELPDARTDAVDEEVEGVEAAPMPA